MRVLNWSDVYRVDCPIRGVIYYCGDDCLASTDADNFTCLVPGETANQCRACQRVLNVRRPMGWPEDP
jgi:hypothetical protein